MASRRRKLFLLLAMGILLGLAASGSEAADQEKKGSESPVGRRIPNFVLPAPDGKMVGLADFQDHPCLIVAFLDTKCPIGNAFVPVLNDLQAAYKARKVQVLGINSHPGDTAETVGKHAREFKLNFPVLVDKDQSALSLFGVQRTCTVYLLDARRNVRYVGRIDDRFGYDFRRDEPKRHDLKEALDEVLAGKKPAVARTEVAGCLIAPRAERKLAGKVTYHRDVAPILHKNCVDCHHPGTAAPFSLLSYEDAANWSAMIKEVVVQRRMPPWQADPRYGKFHNERRLTQKEVDTLVAWVDSGTPEGEGKAKEPPKVAKGWRIGTPDMVFKMPKEYVVQARGTVRYQYFRTPTNFKEDMWVQAAEARPGNAAVVHHIIVFYRVPGKKQVWLAATAPGADPVRFPKGFGRKIPAGAELVWQMHYTPTGKEEKDQSEIGLVFCKEPPQHDVTTHGIANPFFRIPPGASNHQVVSTVPAVKDAVILAFFPHMHLRGKSFEYQAHYPDGRKEVLLSIPQYDFNWQHTYRLAEPLRVPKGTTIRCVAHYDNSAANPANPDPKQAVRWGDQTWEEMMIGYIDFYWDEKK